MNASDFDAAAASIVQHYGTQRPARFWRVADRFSRIALGATIAIAVLMTLVFIGLGVGVIHTYDGPVNTGVTVGVGCTGVGFELRGPAGAGFFTDLCQ